MSIPLDLGLVRQIGQEEELALVVLFGSKGRRSDSDWDLALMPGHSRTDRTFIESRFVDTLQRGDLDFLWLPESSPLAASQVGRTGEVLYQDRPDRFPRFQLLAQLRRDDNRLWQQANRDFIKRTLEGRWTVDHELVTRKLALLARYIQELAPVLQVSQEAFEADYMLHRVAERQIELLVECAATINSEVAQAVAGIPPADYYSSFHSMAATGWVDKETAGRLANLAGLRNRLVHQYEDISLGQLYKVAKRSLSDWRAYLQGVSAQIEK